MPNVPTFLYDYPQAVKDGFLVDFSLYQAHTCFQRKGIKGVDLSEEDRNGNYAGLDKQSADALCLRLGRESRSRRTKVCPADDPRRV
jgi:type I site-specific restriction endonuclease